MLKTSKSSCIHHLTHPHSSFVTQGHRECSCHFTNKGNNPQRLSPGWSLEATSDPRELRMLCMKTSTENSGMSVDMNGNWELPKCHGTISKGDSGGISIACSTVSPRVWQGPLSDSRWGAVWNEWAEGQVNYRVQVNFKHWQCWAAIFPTSQRKNPNDGVACYCGSSRSPRRLKCPYYKELEARQTQKRSQGLPLSFDFGLGENHFFWAWDSWQFCLQRVCSSNNIIHVQMPYYRVLRI